LDYIRIKCFGLCLCPHFVAQTTDVGRFPDVPKSMQLLVRHSLVTRPSFAPSAPFRFVGEPIWFWPALGISSSGGWLISGHVYGTNPPKGSSTTPCTQAYLEVMSQKFVCHPK